MLCHIIMWVFWGKNFIYSIDKALAKPKNMLPLLNKHYLEGSWIIRGKGF